MVIHQAANNSLAPVNLGLNQENPFNQQTQAVTTKKPHFLIENWKRILADAPAGVNRVRVDNGVATVTNFCPHSSGLIIRCQVKLPNGFFNITREGLFTPVHEDLTNRWNTPYPDIEMLRPRADGVFTLSEASQQKVKEILLFISRALSERDFGSRVKIDEDGFHLTTGYNNQSEVLYHPFKLGPEFIVVEVKQLAFAMKEMLRYDMIYFRKEDRGPGANTPLIMGHKWDSCTMVKAVTREY